MRGSFVPDVKKDCSASSKGVLCQHTKGEWGNMLSRKKFTFCIRQTPSQFSSQWSDSIYHITRARKNYANYTQTLHSTLHSADLPRVTKCIVWGANYTQTIHKTIHCNERDKETKRQRDKETKRQRTKDERRKTKVPPFWNIKVHELIPLRSH